MLGLSSLSIFSCLTLVSAVLADDQTCASGRASSCAASFQPPRVIIGCWQLLERHQSPDQAVETLLAYARAGFRAFDTADIYGPSEEILGNMRQRWQDGGDDSRTLLFFTKYVTDDASRTNANNVNAKSLQSLGVQAADLVQFHWWSLARDGSNRDFLQAAQELSRLKREGKIRHLAGCNMDTLHLQMLVEDGMELDANQVQFSLLDRRAENQLLPFCRKQGIKLLIFGVVAGGLLSESFLGISQSTAQRRLSTVSHRMYWTSLMRWTKDWALFQKLLRTLQAIGQSQFPPLSIAAVASIWAFQRMEELGAGGALILGVRDTTHLQDHLAILNHSADLSSKDMLEIQTILDAGQAPQGDIWYQERGWLERL